MPKKSLKALKTEFKEQLLHYTASEGNQIFHQLLEHKLGIAPLQFMMDDQAAISESAQAQMQAYLKRLNNHEPLQHLLEKVFFLDLVLEVNRHVLIPRPETEELIHKLMLQQPNSLSVAVDLGTGSGCIALALKQVYPETEVWAVDKSKKALDLAKRNADLNNLFINFLQADLLKETAKLPASVDLIISNPPYIAQREKANMEKTVIEYEPAQALFVPDEDPLIFYRAIFKYAAKALSKEGVLALEINQNLASETVELAGQLGFKARAEKDFFGNWRFVWASRA